MPSYQVSVCLTFPTPPGPASGWSKLAKEEEDCIRMTTTSVQSNGDVIEVVLTYLSFKYFNHYFMNSIFHSFNYHFNILLLQLLFWHFRSLWRWRWPPYCLAHTTQSASNQLQQRVRESKFSLWKSLPIRNWLWLYLAIWLHIGFLSNNISNGISDNANERLALLIIRWPTNIHICLKAQCPGVRL